MTAIKHEFLCLGLDEAGWYIDCKGGGRYRPEYGDNLADLRRQFQKHLKEVRCPPKERRCG